MRLIVCLVLAAVLFQGTLAVTSSASQKKLMLEKINSLMESSFLGRAMKNMVELASRLNISLDDLEVASNNINDQLLNRKESENDLFDQSTLDHNNSVDTITANINKFTKAVSDGEQNLLDLNKLLTQQQDTLDSRNKDLKTNQDNLDAATKEKEHLITVHDQEVADFNKASEVITEAIEKLQSADTHYDAAKLDTVSFVQVKNTVIAFVQNLKQSTQNMHASHQLFIKPVVMALNQLASSDGDQSSIDKVIDALNQLNAYFAQALKTSNSIYDNDLTNVQGRIDSFNQHITLLTETLIPQSESEVKNTTYSITVASNQLVADNKSLAEAKQALIDENSAYDNITNRHNALIKKITEEQTVVKNAQKIINDARANLEA